MLRWLPHITFLLLLIISALPNYAQEQKVVAGVQGAKTDSLTKVTGDSMVVHINYREGDQPNKRIFNPNKLKGKFSKYLYNTLIRESDESDEGQPAIDFKVNRGYFEYFKGRVITTIRIVHADVFTPVDSAVKESKVQRFVDNLHITTKRSQLEENLMFHVGDTINPYALGINEWYIRNLPYLSTAYFLLTVDKTHPNGVVITLFARDSWTISADLSVSESDTYLSLFDKNFLGTGDELKLSFMCEEPIVNPGLEIQYTARNVMGSFMDANIFLGAGSETNVGGFSLQRPFILPNDRAWGVTALNRKEGRWLPISDTAYYIGRQELEAWYGKSWCLEWRKGTSIYTTASYSSENYFSVPPVTPTLNPLYQSRDMILMSLGYARNNYFQGNMIYGYGRTEDIAYGFRTEVLGGIEWNEYLGRRYYGGMRGYWGDQTKIGYLELGAAFGTFLTTEKQLQQSTLTAHVRYLSPLIVARNAYIRQFLSLESTTGFHRLEGERESLFYERRAGIRGLGSNSNLRGYNRLTLSAEAVYFTPISFYHFRFAFFGFGDLGWLGNSANPFKNQFTGAIGVGVRIKNERLIFNNVQIRIGFAFNRPADIGYSYFAVSNEQTVADGNFAPTRPQIIPYK